MRELELGEGWASLLTDELGDDPTPAGARRAVAQALRERGREPWEDMELELFRGEGGALIIVRRAAERALLVDFGSFEELLAAVSACRREVPASLYARGGDWLIRADCAPGELPAPLLEYGRLRRLPERETLHELENASLLIPRNAMEIIHTYFT